jgi:hypothetical protein
LPVPVNPPSTSLYDTWNTLEIFLIWGEGWLFRIMLFRIITPVEDQMEIPPVKPVTVNNFPRWYCFR